MCVEDDVEFPLFADNDEFTFTLEKAYACLIKSLNKATSLIWFI